MLKIAPYAREVSRKTGSTPDQFRAGIALVKEALRSLDRINHSVIAVTRHDNYAPWLRLKWKVGRAATFRVIVELRGDDVMLHAIMPRTSSTYDDVEALWKKYRRNIRQVASV
ncbi:MAG: hypothetical protein AAFQ07_06870 [Chloroflexota bacterium]